MLCIQNSNTNAWATILNYDANNDWSWGWTNNNPPALGTIGSWTINTMDEYKAGDMNGDGKANELFCIQKEWDF